MIILKIIGILAIAVVLIVVSAAFWFIRRVRQAIKAETQTPSAPCRINPEPEPNPQWRSATLVEQYAGEFRAAGFEQVGAFSIPEMGGLQILGFVHPGESLYGIIYDHMNIDPLFDVVCDFEDDTSVSATNTEIGKTLDKRPDSTLLWLGKMSVAAVMKAVLTHPAKAARRPVSHDGFIVEFKKGYAKSMNWRMKKGGASRGEIKRHADAKGIEITEEQIEASYQSLRASYLKQLQEGCISQFLDEKKTSAAEWERIRERSFAIPETMDVKEVSEALQSFMSLDEEQKHQLGKLDKSFGETGVDVTKKILSQNIGALGLETLGEVQEPVHAIILKATQTA